VPAVAPVAEKKVAKKAVKAEAPAPVVEAVEAPKKRVAKPKA
jgi:hypothetical protein